MVAGFDEYKTQAMLSIEYEESKTSKSSVGQRSAIFILKKRC
ncbi:hypothetical protein J2W55_003913 [Mucilaginibacter pocheonensis]|uniref:Uncharacterized protein n=1 Tax=Mucilaginibacter pocheonensis TaxID=398050 RepID=A0ABU1TF93_9SPHI|nr:hypothetical protein [Mucilaginibacter pocheonensis]